MPKAGTSKAHSDAPGEEAVKETKRNLGMPEDKQFLRSERGRDPLPSGRKERRRDGEGLERSRQTIRKGESGDSEPLCIDIARFELPAGWEKELAEIRRSRGKSNTCVQRRCDKRDRRRAAAMVGGSADLKPSNNTYIKSSADIQSGRFENRNVHYGIREHAMGSAMNGMALYGSVIPFGGTFQTFSDYMRPAIRLAALSKIQTIFVFTHDSIGLGEDGPTHQSVEHLAAMRAIPNLAVIRPCDAHETREAWRAAVKRQHAPTAFALSRQKVAFIDRKKFADAKGLHKGAYVLAEAETKAGKETVPKLIIIATGSEVGLAMEAREKLNADRHANPRRLDAVLGILRRSIAEIRDEVLPPRVTARLAIEAGVLNGLA